MNEMIKRFSSSYRSDLWAFNGPNLLNKMAVELCNFNKLVGPASNQCADLRILPYHMFYPKRWLDWESIFVQNPEENLKRRIFGSLIESYAEHVWNSWSRKKTLEIGSNQAYSSLARQNCPMTVTRAAEFPSHSIKVLF